MATYVTDAHIGSVARALPFSLTDVEQVNSLFARWEQTSDPAAGWAVEVWTYCYLWRYVGTRLSGTRDRSALDADVLFETTYERVLRGMSTIASADRYAHWVSVVCRNTYLNFLRSRQQAVHEPLDEQPSAPVDPTADMHMIQLMDALSAAIARLPSFLSTVARMRYVDNKSYLEIGHATGKSLPVVRAYVHRATVRLRQDARLLRAIG